LAELPRFIFSLFHFDMETKGRKTKSLAKSLAKKNGLYINTHIGTYIESMYVFMCFMIDCYKFYVVGLYTPSESEKRWNYLKDCYRKARNLFKKRQALQQRSGSAGISKSESITPSFRHYDSMTFLNDILEHRQ